MGSRPLTNGAQGPEQGLGDLFKKGLFELSFQFERANKDPLNSGGEVEDLPAEPARGRLSALRLARAQAERASLLLANVRTPAQLKSACNAVDQQLLASLTTSIERIRQEIKLEPLVSAFRSIRELGIDSATESNYTTTRDLAKDVAAGHEEMRQLFELCGPIDFYREVSLNPATKQVVIQAAQIVAEELSRCPKFSSVLSEVGCTPAPSIPSIKDTAAIDLSRLLLSFSSLSVCEIINPAIIEAFDLKPGAAHHMVGLTIVASASLEAIYIQQFLGALPALPQVLEAAPRIEKCLSAIRFQPDKIQHIKLFSAGSPQAIWDIERVRRCANPLRMALTFMGATKLWSAVCDGFQNIPDSQITSIEELRAKLPAMPKGVHILLRHPQMRDIAAGIRIDLERPEVVFRVVGGVSVATDPSSPHLKHFVFFVGSESQLIAASTLNFSPITDLEIQGLFPLRPDLHTIHSQIPRMAAHARFQLLCAKEFAPEFIDRLGELPCELLLEFDADVLLIGVPNEYVDDFLSLYEYDEALHTQLKSALQLGEEQQDTNFTFITIGLQGFDSEVDEGETFRRQELVVQDPAGSQLKREVSRLLRASVTNFEQLFNILKEHFDLRINHDTGSSHAMLHRDNFKFSLAPRFRACDEPLNYPIVFKMFSALNISLEDIKKLFERYE